jgi:hypothetical protein
MATAAASKLALRSSAGTYDHVFFSAMASLMAITVFVGFAPTYYLRAFGNRPMVTIGGMPFTPLFHLHGVLFTAFVVLFIVQTTLVASHRVAVHRRLGIAGGLLAVVMTLVGTVTAITAVSRGSVPPGMDPLVFLAIPLFEMLLFAIFVGAALWLRANKAVHKRLMLLAYISIISAAVVRLPGVQSDLFGDDLALLFLLAGIVYDLVTQRRVHPAYVGGGALLVVSVPLRLMVSRTETWRAFAELVTR